MTGGNAFKAILVFRVAPPSRSFEGAEGSFLSDDLETFFSSDQLPRFASQDQKEQHLWHGSMKFAVPKTP